MRLNRCLLGFYLALLAGANQVALAQQVLPVYAKGRIPYNLPGVAKAYATPKQDSLGRGWETKIGVPTLTYYAPAAPANGGAVMVVPGGGYAFVSTRNEGEQVAQWLTARGYAAFVLRYRLPDTALVEATNRRWVPLADAIMGMETIKENAAALGIDTGRIGAIGFSAGGHLVGMLATVADKHPFGSRRARPAYTALIYPGTSVEGLNPGTRKRLLQNQLRTLALTDSLFSPSYNVKATTPPAFLVMSMDDNIISPGNAIQYAEALRAKGVQAELHLYPTGGHGYGLAQDKTGTVAGWPALLAAWLQGR